MTSDEELTSSEAGVRPYDRPGSARERLRAERAKARAEAIEAERAKLRAEVVKPKPATPKIGRRRAKGRRPS